MPAGAIPTRLRRIAIALVAGAAMLPPLAAAQIASNDLPGLDEKIDLSGPLWGASRAGQYLAGHQAQRQNDPAAAARFLEQALGHDPNNLGLVRHVFILMVAEGQLDDASQHARMILNNEPAAFVPTLTLAVRALKAGEYHAALGLFGNLDNTAHYGMMRALGQAWAAAGAGDLTAARAALSFPISMRGWDAIQTIHRALIEDLAKGNPEEAYAALEASPAGRSAASAALLQNFRDRQADPSAAALITEPAEGLALAFGTIASALARGDTNLTSTVYAQMGLWLSPQDERLLLALADALQSKDRYKDAAEAYSRVPATSDYYYPAQIARVRNLAAADEQEAAIALTRELAAAHPDNGEALRELGNLLRRDKRFEEAADAYNAAFDRIAANGGKADWQLYYTRGIAYERIGEWTKAEADFRKALELENEQPLVLNYLGYSWIDRGENLEEGAAMVRRAAELRPDDGYIADSVGWAAYRMGDYEEAVSELERAILIEPLDPTINEHLGDLYWLVGRKIEARYQWERAMSFDPEPERIAGLEERLACTDEVCAPLQKEEKGVAQ